MADIPHEGHPLPHTKDAHSLIEKNAWLFALALVIFGLLLAYGLNVLEDVYLRDYYIRP